MIGQRIDGGRTGLYKLEGRLYCRSTGKVRISSSVLWAAVEQKLHSRINYHLSFVLRTSAQTNN